ncbi:MAG: asparagine synthase (glutamine-hydrolyzing) [Deltaproteobacteria bacterium]|nr:asparagine synthase (glutamine-hydrolyzing) [Deltaproteobacteria bacterium]
MCGIAGFFARKNFDRFRDCLPRAVESLAHRGPDDSGLFFDEAAGVGLGQRRLAVIDLSPAGHQPMLTEDGRFAIVYNGETYNFREVRAGLEKRGESFFSGSDTEVILKAFRFWGPECLSRFSGMFALAIWDAENRRLFLARDRMGKKPLYYAFSENGLVFGSELKALMAFPGVCDGIDSDALGLYLHYQYVPGPLSIFSGVKKLLPGHFAVYDGETLEVEQWYRLPTPAPDASLSASDAEDELDRLATAAVSDRLVSDVPVGALLSGGIDSSLVTALMAKAAGGRVKTFSIGFSEKGFDEAPYARAVADHLGTDHTCLYVSPEDALSVVPRLPEIYDEPFADSSGIPTFLVSHLAKSSVTVALSGDGGDEQFGGYVRYATVADLARVLARVPAPVRLSAAFAMRHFPASWAKAAYLPWRPYLPQRFKVENFPDKWDKLVKVIGQKGLSELYRMTVAVFTPPEVAALTGKPPIAGVYEEAFSETTSWPALLRLLHADRRTYLPDAMLTKVDRASMAVALEVRVPLLDHRIFGFTAKLPEKFLMNNGVGKILARRVLARYVPQELFERPKMGFGVPVGAWLKNELKPLLLDHLSDERIRREGLFDPSFVSRLVSSHLDGSENHAHRLWALLMWEMWRDRWLKS